MVPACGLATPTRRYIPLRIPSTKGSQREGSAITDQQLEPRWITLCWELCKPPCPAGHITTDTVKKPVLRTRKLRFRERKICMSSWPRPEGKCSETPGGWGRAPVLRSTRESTLPPHPGRGSGSTELEVAGGAVTGSTHRGGTWRSHCRPAHQRTILGVWGGHCVYKDT